MEINERNNETEKYITSREGNEFMVRGFGGYRFQIEIENDGDFAFMDVGLQELVAIRKIIDEAIRAFSNDEFK